MDALHNDAANSAMALLKHSLKVFDVAVSEQLTRPGVSVGDILTKHGVA